MSGGMYDGIVCNEEGAPVYEDGSELQFTDSGDIMKKLLTFHPMEAV